MRLPFVKMQGCGNDFVVLDGIGGPLPPLDDPTLTRFLCDRRFGIGCDQLLVLKEATRADADYQMLVYNSDASRVEMCGNGIRCLAKFLMDKGYSSQIRITFQTLAGLIVTERIDDESIEVDMGMPIVDGHAIPVDHDGEALLFPLPVEQPEHHIVVSCVSMGNPHCVVYVDHLENVDFNRLGPYLSTHPFFPKGANVEFTRVLDRHHLHVKVWERGAGPTLACGTGACAAAVAAIIDGKADHQLEVTLPGGTLLIDWDPESRHVFMTGPAVSVYEGVIAL